MTQLPPEGELDAGIPDIAEPAEMEPDELGRVLESLLLVVDTPVTAEALASATEQPVYRVAAKLRLMADELTERDSGIDLRHTGEGWRFYTRADCAEVVQRYVRDGQQARLTQAALETLAVVAYRQPVARARISAVRGVNVDGVIRTLTSRGLIAEAGHEEHSGAILYRTTELFLERLGIRSLEDLPPVADYLPDIELLDEFIDNTSSGD